jgi:hypothetical protein
VVVVAPQPHGFAEQLEGARLGALGVRCVVRCRGRVAVQEPAGLRDQVPEPEQVDLVGVDVEAVAPRRGHDDVGPLARCDARLQQAAQLRHVRVHQAGRAGRRRVLVPGREQEIVEWHGLVRAHRQHGEDGALFQRPQVDFVGSAPHADGTQYLDPQSCCRFGL